MNDLGRLYRRHGACLLLRDHRRLHSIMSRAIRLFLYFVIGVLLGTASVLAHAQTANAVKKWNSSPPNSDFQQACQTVWSAGGNNYTFYGMTDWRDDPPGLGTANCARAHTGAPYCPDGVTCGVRTVEISRNWYCPDGYNNPTLLNGVMVCQQVNLCESKAGQERFYWLSFNGPAPTGAFCDAGCELYKSGPVSHPTMNPDGETYIGGTAEKHWLMKDQFSGAACTVGQPTYGDNGKHEDSVKPPYPPKKPKCGATEGVLTTDSGKVHCIPEGNPAATKPKVETQKKKETFSDGSAKETETTKTTDTTTGASHTSTSTTVTAGPTGGTQAGTPGTGTGESEESEECEGEDCGECDPKLEMCGDPAFDGMYEKKEKTVGSVLNGFSSGMQSTPIGEAFTGVFDIQTPAGSCPNLSANIPYLNTSIDLAPYICSATAIQYLEAMGTILKVVVGYIAITWILF